MTTPADEITAAATRLRALATAAANDSGSPHWEAKRLFPQYPDSTATRLRANPGGPLLHGGGGIAPMVTGPVGDYIAAIDPTVGLALADLLDDQADGDDEGVINPWALAMARAINTGEQP